MRRMSATQAQMENILHTVLRTSKIAVAYNNHVKRNESEKGRKSTRRTSARNAKDKCPPRVKYRLEESEGPKRKKESEA